MRPVSCPTCKKTGDWFAGKYGPFCSHRCKLIDLGKWFGGQHAISEPLRPEHFEKDGGIVAGDRIDVDEEETD
jgi:endogenous inhibitor of DNA gyrase (YacG/DUF329 family)